MAEIFSLDGIKLIKQKLIAEINVKQRNRLYFAFEMIEFLTVIKATNLYR